MRDLTRHRRLVTRPLRHSFSAIHLTRPGATKSPRPNIVIHGAALPPRDLATIKRLPVTTMRRTVINMAAVCDEETVDIALDDAIRSGIPRVQFLRRLDDLAAPGRNGIAIVKKLVAERVVEQGLTDSAFERLLLRALRKGRLPLPVCQMVIGDARVDFVYPDRGLVIEADG